MFFDYIKNRYGLEEHARISGKPSNYLWQISEAFNKAIEAWEPYRKVFKYSNSRSHPGTEKLSEQMILRWAHEPNIEKFLDHYFAPVVVPPGK
jgi:hypothetical protein